MLVLSGIIAMNLAVAAMGVGGVLLVRDLFSPHQQPDAGALRAPNGRSSANRVTMKISTPHFETKVLPPEPDAPPPTARTCASYYASSAAAWPTSNSRPARPLPRSFTGRWRRSGTSSRAGEMWRRYGDDQDVVPVEAGVCITIPPGTCFSSAPLALCRFRHRSYDASLARRG